MIYDVNDVRPIVQQLIQDNPRNRNPRNYDLSCLYLDEHGNMCLIGAMLDELDLPIPDRIASIVVVVLDNKDLYPFTDDAVRYMERIQAAADRIESSVSVRWGSVDEPKIYRETFQ